MTNDSLLTAHEVVAKVHMSIGWVYKQIRAGKFPEPLKFGFTSRWSELEVNGWIAAKREERDARSQRRAS